MTNNKTSNLCTNCKGIGTEPLLDSSQLCRKCNGSGCSKKHWKKIGKRTRKCPNCDEVLTLGVPL